MKTLGATVGMTLCALLAASPGLTQEDAPKTSSDRDAPQADVIAAPGTEAKRKGTTAPGDARDMQSNNQGVASGHGVTSMRPNEGLAALLRRANRGPSIANTPSGPSARAGAQPPFARPGADGGAMRNSIGVAVPSGGQNAGSTAQGFAGYAGSGANGSASGAIGGRAAGNVGGIVVRHPAFPLNPVPGPAAHAAAINGTTMGQIGSGPGYVGGPAKDRSGINGTTMRPKR